MAATNSHMKKTHKKYLKKKYEKKGIFCLPWVTRSRERGRSLGKT
jgi:hypothetical protein